jgi:hypothetical protein
VKTALEAADMDLPEPTYRLHLSGGALTGGVAAQSGEATAFASLPAGHGKAGASGQTADRSSSVAPADTRALHELDAQIEHDVQRREGANLLEHQAPME